MARDTRERRLNEAFVQLADTLTEEYDVLAMLQMLITETAAITESDEGGLMLSNGTDTGATGPAGTGPLELMVSTSERAELVELMQLSAGEGPCLDCFRSGVSVSVPDIAAESERWPEFASAAVRTGLRSMHATPMRLRGEVIGTLNLFRTELGALTEQDVATTQALADVATIGIIHERIATHSRVVTEQLQRALNSRVLIEQAKGVLAQANDLSMDEAFSAIRQYARGHNLTLRDVADGITRRTLGASLFSI